MVPALLRPKSQQIHLKATMKGWKYNYRDPRSVIGQNATIDELYVAFLKGLIDVKTDFHTEHRSCSPSTTSLACQVLA